MKNIILLFALNIICFNSYTQDIEPFEITEAWLSQIKSLAPVKTTVAIDGKKNILIFSLHTGYEHWNIPHTEAVLTIIGEKANAFTFILSKDINEFKKEKLQKYDAIILNNTCSKRDFRNLFYDVYSEDKNLTQQQAFDLSKNLENNLLDYVESGKGLMLIHGAIVMQNKSDSFGKMVGGSFDYHPKQQPIKVKLVDPSHPLVASFNRQGFTHVDEPYFFMDEYYNYNFRPLLYMDANDLDGLREKVTESTRYIAWIKRYGKGRIFYSSPSHNPQSFENKEMLQFLLDGMQYVVGDLECDDSPFGLRE
ncbi:MAG: ThuA domain-containing protein [Eudoraea sp.]